jgi:hypothetical protein
MMAKVQDIRYGTGVVGPKASTTRFLASFPLWLHPPSMPDRQFLDLDALIRQIEATACDAPDPVAILVTLMKVVITSDADPYVLTGALVEGITTTIAQKIPPEKRGEVAVESLRLLRDRLASQGLI